MSSVKTIVAVASCAAIVALGTPSSATRESPSAPTEQLANSLRPDNEAILFHDEGKVRKVTDEPDEGSLAKNSSFDSNKVAEVLEGVLPGSDLGVNWITASSPDVLVIETTAASDGVQRLQVSAENLLPGRVVVKTGLHSKEELTSYKTKLLEAIDSPSSIGFAVRSDDLSLAGSGVVRVTIAPEFVNDKFIDGLTQIIPRDALEIKMTGAPTNLLSVDRDIYPPVRGGNRITETTNGAQCSEGFVYAGAFGYFGSTAGHCYYHGRINDPVKMASTTLDYVRDNKFEQGSNAQTIADVAIYSLSANGRSWSKGLQINDSVVRQVSSRYIGSRAVGSAYCAVGDGDYFSAHYTDQECGSVTQSDTSINNASTGANITDIQHVDCGSAEFYGGWSGGPVYLTLADGKVKAAGTIVSGDVGGGCWIPINFIVFMLGTEIDFY